jgi:hypothetical protein
VRDQLDKLVQELLDKGVLYEDARREFEKMFIARALQRSKGNVAAPPRSWASSQHHRAQDFEHESSGAPNQLAVSTPDCLTRDCSFHTISSRPG